MKKLLSILLAVAMLLSLGVTALADEAGGETPVVTAPYTVPEDVAGKVVILHTNDVHGAVENYAKVAQLKKLFQDAGAEVLLLDAGDFSQGETYVSVSQGKTAIELMDLAGYDAAAPGNHEFDYGYTNLKELAELADFPILAANVFYDNVLAFDCHVVKEVGGKRIGIFGLDTPETATKAHPAKIQGVTFQGGEELYQTAQVEVDTLRKVESVDVVVCLGHLGVDEESAANGNRSIDLLDHVTGIDVFIDGHSHSTLEEVKAATNGTGKVGDTVLTSTGTKLESVGVVILDDEITVERVPLEAIPEGDATVAEAAKAVVDAVKELYGQVFAKSEVELNGEKAPGNRTQETNLGDLICDAMVWQVTKDGALSVPRENVVAITNGGGIRASIAAGDITRNDVNKVLPFGNTVATVYITGSALLEALEASTFCTPTAVGGFPQVSGLRFTVDTAVAFDAGENYPGTTYAKPNSVNRVTIQSVNGYSFDPNATYAVVTNDFVAAGGDTYYTFSTSPDIVDTGVPLDEALMAYITEELDGVVGAAYAQPQGRITVAAVGLDSSAWYAAAAKTVLDKGIMQGTGNGFEPDGLVTRATVVQTLYNMEGKPEINNKMATFPDAQGTWYENAVRWAEQAEVTNGDGSGRFNGEDAVTRAELVVFLNRYAQQKGHNGAAADVNLLDYADGELLTAWAIPSFQWAVGNQILSGKTTETGSLLAPGDTATRAELAQILCNYIGFFPLNAQ